MSQELRIGIVGLGRLGKRHASNLAFRVPGASLVAAASPVEEERRWAERALPGVRIYSGLPDLLADQTVEAVWLVTPTSLHADQTIAVLEAGKHVFCEKPLALEVEDCDRVLDVARRHGGQLAMVGFMRRFDRAYAEAKRRIDAGELGQVFHIACRSEDPIDPDGFFVKFAPTSGGIFLDCCIHDIDLVQWMLDGAKPVGISATGTRIMYPALGECGDVDNGFATVTFESGAVATFHVSRTSHQGYEATMSLSGTKAGIDIGAGLTRVPTLSRSTGGRFLEGQTDFFQRFDEAFLLEANAFVEAVRSGKPSPLSLEDAREATDLACRLRDALKV
ncbi:Gfo/Idh/MocA family oxidoreductase [Consotaella salsifontis]|uniref:Myo-inositol 2-dehydrogenase / D-chiro-inositol 1-dehydrogenase n=1 Tax=Consotaella salsifontis TaxID=1365950 RepID=A0A1T4RML9_9HYPH|nr:Gfo/Idh/MocA family oxidoreductase [Consotaella salsifontis]SKA16988.1 myo-inositol 2-dehydrogenase / D-chiro-inositol 1-dehydrogenase [Consotaella salsifontis]